MKKKDRKLINTHVITRHNVITIFRDGQLWKSSFIIINYNGADLMPLFKEVLSLIIRKLSFNSNTNFLFSLAHQHFAKMVNGYKVTNDR